MSISRSRFAQRNQNSTSFRSEKQGIGPVSNTIILIVLACLLGLFYLAQVTKTNAYGYQINELSQKQTELRATHDQLEVASARLQSVERVKNSKPAKSLVSVAPTTTLAN
jgi:hypothetical protein